MLMDDFSYMTWSIIYELDEVTEAAVESVSWKYLVHEFWKTKEKWLIQLAKSLKNSGEWVF